MQTNSVVLDVTTLSHCPFRPLPRFSLLGTREKCRLSKTLETRPFTRAYYAPRPSIILTFQSVLLLPPSPVLHTFVPKRCARRQAQDKSVASIFILFYFFYFYFFFSLSLRFKICETVIPLSLDIITRSVDDDVRRMEKKKEKGENLERINFSSLDEIHSLYLLLIRKLIRLTLLLEEISMEDMVVCTIKGGKNHFFKKKKFSKGR